MAGPMLRGRAWKICPSPIQRTVITASAEEDPMKATVFENFAANRPAVKKQLSPISEAKISKKAFTKPEPSAFSMIACTSSKADALCEPRHSTRNVLSIDVRILVFMSCFCWLLANMFGS
mmetsp:Transcript_126212/g.243311  ORF Transcript_126212/g.243311 Transcript_126212/m.243311 type:complete len:120 (-) Transcript_126212:322-681(-)